MCISFLEDRRGMFPQMIRRLRAHPKSIPLPDLLAGVASAVVEAYGKAVWTTWKWFKPRCTVAMSTIHHIRIDIRSLSSPTGARQRPLWHVEREIHGKFEYVYLLVKATNRIATGLTAAKERISCNPPAALF